MRWWAVLAVVGCGKHTPEAGPRTDCGDPIELAVSYATYDVHGSSWEEVRADIDARSPAPDGFDGWTAIDFAYACHERDGAIAMELEASVVVTLPAWVEAADPEAWRVYSEGLRKHEDGHVAIYERGYMCVVAEAREQPDCEAAKRFVGDRAAAVEDAQAKFDVDTNHGRNGD